MLMLARLINVNSFTQNYDDDCANICICIAYMYLILTYWCVPVIATRLLNMTFVTRTGPYMLQ